MPETVVDIGDDEIAMSTPEIKALLDRIEALQGAVASQSETKRFDFIRKTD